MSVVDPRIARVTAAIGKIGKPVTLRRITATPSGQPPIYLDVVVNAVVNNFQPSELIGGQSGIVQGDRKVTIASQQIIDAQWPWPVKTGDKVIIDGKPGTVQGMDMRNIGADDAMVVLTVRG